MKSRIFFFDELLRAVEPFLPGLSEGASNNPQFPEPWGGHNGLYAHQPEEGDPQPVGSADDLGDSSWGRKQITEARQKLNQELQNARGTRFDCIYGEEVRRARIEQQRIF